MSCWLVIVSNALPARLQLPASMLQTAAAAAATLQLQPLTITVKDEAVYAINELLLIIVVSPASCMNDQRLNELQFNAFTRPQRPTATWPHAELSRSPLLCS
jgi:hypothetical protein